MGKHRTTSPNRRQPRVSKALNRLRDELGLNPADWLTFLKLARKGFSDWERAHGVNARSWIPPRWYDGGKLNRTSLRRCVMIVQRLLPAVLLVWIDHGSDEDWGLMCYPPVKSTR